MNTGADERTRTADLLITNQLLYQLSYVGATHPERLLGPFGITCKAAHVSTRIAWGSAFVTVAKRLYRKLTGGGRSERSV